MITKQKRHPWAVVAMLWVVALLNYMDRQMLSTMKPAMQIDIAELTSATNFGRLMAIFLWIYGLMSPLAGLVADRVNRKWLITISLLVWSTVTLAMGYADSFNQLYWLRAIMGVSEALYIPAALSLIADYHTSGSRSLAIGIHMTGLYIGQALGGFGATVAERLSWQEAFHYFGWAGVIYSLFLAVFLKEKRGRVADDMDISTSRQNSWWKGMSLLFGQIAFWVILFYFAVSSLPGWGIKNWLPTLFSQSLRIDMSVAGPLSTITIAASSLLGVLFGGVLSDRWVQQNLRGRIYTSTIGLSLTIPALILLSLGSSLPAVIGAAFCFGFGYGMFDANNMPILCQFIAPRFRATAYGLMNMAGVFAGALITGWLGKSTDEGSLAVDFALLSGVVAIAIVLQLLLLHPRHKDFTEV